MKLNPSPCGVLFLSHMQQSVSSKLEEREREKKRDNNESEKHFYESHLNSSSLLERKVIHSHKKTEAHKGAPILFHYLVRVTGPINPVRGEF